MRRMFAPVTGLLFCVLLLTAWSLLHTIPSTNKNMLFADSTVFDRNISPDIQALNSDKKVSPPKSFRSGYVTKSHMNNYLEKTSNGYYIKLPSSTNVPTPAVLNGTLFLSGGFGSKQYYAFDAGTGALKWAVDTDDDGPSSPAIQDDVIVFNTESCTIFACDARTGEQLWSYWLGDPLMSMPTIANGIVFTAYPASYTGKIEQRKKRFNCRRARCAHTCTHSH